MSRWNPEMLKRMLGEHIVSGYKVEVPIFGRATIDRQIRPERGGFIFYRVIADKPISFKTFAKRMNVSGKPLSMKQWREKFVKGSSSFPAIAHELRERLEAGGEVSQADVLFQELMDRGCVDLDQNVFCHTFPSDDVSIVDPEPGQLVEIVDRSGTGMAGWPSVFSGYETSGFPKKALGLFQQFSPAPYMRTPEALLPAAVRRGYVVPVTWTLGYGLAHALEDTGHGLPPSSWSESGEEYVLEKPIPLAEIDAFCEDPRTWKKLNQGKNIFCLQQAMMLHTLPLIMEEISLRPLPEGAPDNIVVTEVTDILGPEAGDFLWPE